jgi:hypothetical protein
VSKGRRDRTNKASKGLRQKTGSDTEVSSLSAVDEFERVSRTILKGSLELSEKTLADYQNVTLKTIEELDTNSYLRLLRLWQDAFTHLVENAFPDLTVDDMLDDIPGEAIRVALESDWLRRFDFVEGAIRHVLVHVEVEHKEDILEILTQEAMDTVNAGEVLELFTGSWAISLDGKVSHRAKQNRFILCERAIITDTLYSARAEQGRDEEWWIGPSDVKPLTLTFPFDMVTDFVSPSDVRYRTGVRKAAYDMRLRLQATEDIDEENRLPLVLNALGALKHLVIFEEADINIAIEQEDGESDHEFATRRTQIANLVQEQLAYEKNDIGFSISLVVEGQARKPAQVRIVSSASMDMLDGLL